MNRLSRLRQSIRPAAARLALSYLAILMVVSVGLSVVVYEISASSLQVQIPDIGAAYDPSKGHDKTRAPSDTATSALSVEKISNVDIRKLNRQLEQHIVGIRKNTIEKLIIFNLTVLVGGATLCYYLARRTLAPIEAVAVAQSRFASDASHEFRTPLTIMQAENEEGLTVPGLPTQTKRLLTSNLEEIERLSSVSEGLLQLARNETLIMRPVWADDISNEAVNRIAKVAQERHVSVEDTWPHLQVLANDQALIQLLLILLDNAIKYSPAKSTVYLESSRTDKQVQLQVRDEGIGISTEDLPYLFNRFYRASQPSTDSHPKSHGLGLSIARKLADQLHCKLSVESGVGQGSTFTIILKLS